MPSASARRPWRRPPWWPQDQPWPPRGRGRRWGPPFFVWRLGCLLAALVALATVGALLAALFAARAGLAGLVAILLLVGVVVFLGVRELRSVGRAFGAMNARLRANEERRRSFLADVTHELRTPLAIIRGQAEAIADGVYPGDPEHLAPIIDAVRTLEGLTEDLRTLALSEAGSLSLAREATDLAALVHDAVAAFGPQAEAAGVTLIAEAGDLPAADVDPARMRSVLGNLVSNALRHTPSGGAVGVGVRGSGDRIEITVTDNGEGIPPALLPRVFERFVRTPGSRGSGLGLAIARDIVTAHGGTIDIESALGSGTTVRISLPTGGSE